MKDRYYVLDNTPKVGRINTFICHVSNGKGLVHFMNADIFPKPIRIINDKKNKTNCYVLRVYVKNAIDVVDDKKGKHIGFEIDQNSIEAIPIKPSKGKQKVSVFIKEQSFKVDGFCFAKQVQGFLSKGILKCFSLGIDISDCCKEITKEDYKQYLADQIEQKRIKRANDYNKLVQERLIASGIKISDLTIHKKYYSKADDLFFIIKEDFHSIRQYKIAYLDFDSFYKACNSDISGADLCEYDFKGINGKKYNFGSAIINSSTKIALGLYTPNKINELIHDNNEKASLTPSVSEDLVPTRMEYGVAETYPIYEEDDNVFLYISDLHINHKLLRKNIDPFNSKKIDEYFEKIVLSLKKTIPLTYSYYKNIFIIGDVSFNYEVFQRFFRQYSRHIATKTFFVLGNHELWDFNLCQKYKDFDAMVNEFRSFLNSVDITLLENELYVPSLYYHKDELKHIYSYEEILALDKETISKMFDANSYLILGGMGFAGLNKDFNSLNGIYRNAPIDRKFEIKRSRQLSEIHKKIKEVASNKRVLVVSHMPPNDWCSDTLCPNWYYMYGHTHKNSYLESDELTYYADNQIGYNNTSFGFKFFSVTSRFNIFSNYTNGIHEITREQYVLFYNGIGEHSSINRDFYKLFLLKNGLTMMFLMQKKENGPFFIMNGGQIKKTNGENFEYYYSKMNNYAQSVKLFLKDYSNYQKRIANEIKKMGGFGTIHGAIIDINMFCHIYLNPLDGSIIPYWASSMTNKIVYKNIPSLLMDRRVPLVYENYIKLVENNENKNNLVILKDSEINLDVVFVPETDMYRISRLIKGLQYTTDFDIIRLWNYSIAETPSKENGRLIVAGIINPTENQDRDISVEKKKK